MFRHVLFCALNLVFTFAASETLAASVKHTELQWVLCEPNVTAFTNKIQTQIPAPSERQVYYHETTGLDLFLQKAIYRIRLDKNGIKSAVKINFTDDSNLPSEPSAEAPLKCEWDRYQSYKKVGCAMTSKISDIKDPLTKDQKIFLQSQTGFSDFQNLIFLGPALSHEWIWHQKNIDEDLVLEFVTGPNGYSSLELSTRVSTKIADAVEVKVSQWLQDKQILLCPVQRGKTESLLRALLPVN